MNDTDAVTPPTEKHLAFRLGSETYAIPLSHVQEIGAFSPITRLPSVPAFILGVTNLRGSIIVVMDIRRRLGLTVEEAAGDGVIVVVVFEGRTYGLRVDSVTDVVEVPVSSAQAQPLTGNPDSRFVSGLAEIDGSLVILLDLATVFDVGAIAVGAV